MIRPGSAAATIVYMMAMGPQPWLCVPQKTRTILIFQQRPNRAGTVYRMQPSHIQAAEPRSRPRCAAYLRADKLGRLHSHDLLRKVDSRMWRPTSASRIFCSALSLPPRHVDLGHFDVWLFWRTRHRRHASCGRQPLDDLARRPAQGGGWLKCEDVAKTRTAEHML